MKNPVIDDRSAEQWERIKNFVGAGKKAPKHPLVQEAERQQMRQPQHLDEGGVAGDDPFGSNDPNDPRGTIQALPNAPITPGIPATPQNAPIPANVPSQPMDAGFNKQASDIMGGITPETINRLMQSLSQQNTKGQIGAGIAGIGDAIQSVGGIHGENMKNAEDTIAKNRDVALKVPGEMAAIGKERYGITKELGGDEPGSVRSFTAQNANMPLLSKMGFTPEQVKAMPASLIDGIRSGSISAQEAGLKLKELQIQGQRADTEAKQAEGTLANQEMERKLQEEGMAQTKEHQTAEENLAASGKRQEAAKALNDRGLFRRAIDLLPGKNASDILKEEAGIGGNRASQTQNFTAPQIGQTVVHPNGAKVTRHK